MKSMLYCMLLPLALSLTDCQGGHDTQIGNGFFLRGSGVTAELHTAVVALHMKKDGRSVRIWPFLTAGHGGPYLIEDGILFCARNLAGKVGLFVANKRGVVSEVTAFVLPALSSESEVRQIKEVGDKVQVDLWNGAGQPVSASVKKSEFIRLAEKRVLEGERVRRDGSEYYR